MNNDRRKIVCQELRWSAPQSTRVQKVVGVDFVYILPTPIEYMKK